MADTSSIGQWADQFLVVRHRDEIFVVPWDQLQLFRNQSFGQQGGRAIDEFFGKARGEKGYGVDAAVVPAVVILDGDIAPPGGGRYGAR